MSKSKKSGTSTGTSISTGTVKRGRRPMTGTRPPQRLQEVVPDNSTGVVHPKGWVVAANPDSMPLTPVPTLAEVPVLVRTTKLRFAYVVTRGDRDTSCVEITVPKDICTALNLEVGMVMVWQCYGDGRMMLTRAGMYVSPETRTL